MPVALFETKAPRSVVADWVELTALLSERGSTTSADLIRAQSVREEPDNGDEFDAEEGETLDAEILDSRDETLRDNVWDELEYRRRILGDLYPFELSARGTGWVLALAAPDTSTKRVAHQFYVACLLISALRYRLLPKRKKGEDALYTEVYQTAPKAFQALSYLTAGEVVSGDAYWFGWPRIDATPTYRSALEKLVSLIGHGKVKSANPAWSKKAEKDGTVDVVAWRSFADRRYQSRLLLGQVASGSNWRRKPIKAYIAGYFFDWFEDNPSTHYLPAMFIPFPLHEDVEADSEHTFEEVAIDQARRDEADYGLVLDRLRLVGAAAAAAERGAKNLKELEELIALVLRWMVKARKYASAEIAA